MEKLAQQVFGEEFKLRAEQKEGLETLMKGEDVWAQLPTGFGKSVLFSLFPRLKSTVTVSINLYYLYINN